MIKVFKSKLFGFGLAFVLLFNFLSPPELHSSEEHDLRIAQESLEEFRQQRREAMNDRQEEFWEYAQERSEEFKEFYEKRQRKFEQFKQDIAQKWGEYQVEVSTKKQMASYSEDKSRRSLVDFKAGKVKAEVLTDTSAAEKSPDKLRSQLRDVVEGILTKTSFEDQIGSTELSGDTSRPTERASTEGSRESEQASEAGKSDEKTDEDPTGEPSKDRAREVNQPGEESSETQTDDRADSVEFDTAVLSGQVETDDGDTVDQSNVQDFAENATSEDKVDTEPVKGEDGKERVKASVEFDLISNHVEKRAKKYLDEVRSMADRFEVEPSVVLAVMHTESSFNPKARSHIPAYGLMQLVPGTGGKAAYKHVYGEERVLKPGYLYKPKKNIELGAGYLNLVYYRYLDGIENSRSRLFCALASYNTGPGNLAKTFVGSTNLSKAKDVINTLSSEEVYSKLRESLPYDETKKYIKKIRDRQNKYEKWLNSRT